MQHSQGVRPHGDKFEDLPGHAKSPSETVGIWHLQLDGEGKKVKDIFFLRQLSPDEIHRKVSARGASRQLGGALGDVVHRPGPSRCDAPEPHVLLLLKLLMMTRPPPRGSPASAWRDCASVVTCPFNALCCCSSRLEMSSLARKQCACNSVLVRVHICSGLGGASCLTNSVWCVLCAHTHSLALLLRAVVGGARPARAVRP